MAIKKNKTSLFKIISLITSVFALPVGLFLLNKQTSFFNRAYDSVTGRSANLVIDPTINTAATPNWTYLAQGGEEQNGMLSPVVNEVRRLRPQYIRIDHVFDFYKVVGRDSTGNLTFDFSRLDAEIAAIRRTGAKPFIALSYMPEVISAGNEVDNAKDWGEWQLVVRRTIEHISGTGGLAIADVYYEVWNEPDLFGSFKIGGSKNYLNLYSYAARGAMQAQSVLLFKFGGPATTGLYLNWFDELYKFTRTNGLRYDFFSWHRYSHDVNDFVKDVDSVEAYLSDISDSKNLILAITETGPDPQNNSVYDTSKSAVHTLAIHAATFGKVSMIFDFEVKDGPGPAKNWGRWGLLTREKYGTPTVKPRYRAIEFLNRMTGTPIQLIGWGTWVKAFALNSLAENTIRVLVVNYDRFSAHSETVPIQFTNLPFSTFKARRINFLGGISESSVSVNGNSWTMYETFSPNTAAIIELIKI